MLIQAALVLLLWLGYASLEIWSLGPKIYHQLMRSCSSYDWRNRLLLSWHKNRWSEQPSFTSNWTRTPNLSHQLCHWAATTRQPVALTILYRHCTGSTVCFNCTHRATTQYVPSELCYIDIEQKIHQKKMHAEWYPWVLFRLVIASFFISNIFLFPSVARCLNTFFHLRWRLWWIQILCSRWWLTMTSEESRYIYISYCSSGLLNTCKHLANLPKNCIHTYAYVGS